MTTSDPDRGTAASTPLPTGVTVLDVGAPATSPDDVGVPPTPTDRVRAALREPGVRCLVLVVDGSAGAWSDDTVLAVVDASAPVVALLRGRVEGRAAAVALAADLRLADETASVRVEPLVGGTSATLPRVVGESTARLLLLSPRSLDATEALARGLVHEVHATAEAALSAALSLAADVAEQAGLGAAVRRALTPRGAGSDVGAALADEARLRAVVELHGPD